MATQAALVASAAGVQLPRHLFSLAHLMTTVPIIIDEVVRPLEDTAMLVLRVATYHGRVVLDTRDLADIHDPVVHPPSHLPIIAFALEGRKAINWATKIALS